MFGSGKYNTLPNLESGDDHEKSEPKTKEKRKTSNIGTFLHLVKGNVGTGILAMPIAISNFGLLAGTIGIIFLGICCIYCMQLLVFCSKVHVAEKARRKKTQKVQPDGGRSNTDENAKIAADKVVTIVPKEIIQKPVKLDTSKNLFYFIISTSRLQPPSSLPCYNSLNIQTNERKQIPLTEQKQNNTNDSGNQTFEENLSLDFADTTFEAFHHGPKPFRSWANFMRFAVNLLLVLTQFGFCCVYFLFVGESIHQVLKNTKVIPQLSATTIMVMVLPIMILLNFIPNLDMLTGVSTTAIGLQGVGLFMMFIYFVTGEAFKAYYNNNLTVHLASVEKWPLFFGTAMFSFEGIGVVLPLENEIKRKRSFKKILNVGMTVVVCLYLLIGVFGYLKFGNDVKPSITFNLPVGCFSEVIRLLFALAIFLSYPLQMYVPFTFILPYMKRKFVCDGCNKYGRAVINGAIRAFLVCITFVIAVTVPMLDLVISFIGAFASSTLAVIFPPFIHAITIWKYKDIKCKIALLCFDIFLALLGIIGLIVGAYTSVSEMTKRNTTVALYDELMSSVIDETIFPLSSNNFSCCSLIK